MTAAELVDEARRVGLALDAEGDRLLVSPAERLTDDMRLQLIARKADLLALLTTRPLLPPADDPLPPGARELMGWLDELGPMDSGNLALALGWPVGSTVGLALRLLKLGLLRSKGGTWALTRKAEEFALFPPEPRR